MIIIQGKNVIKFIREVYTKWHGVLEGMGVCIHFLGNQAKLYEEYEMWTKLAGFLCTDRKNTLQWKKQKQEWHEHCEQWYCPWETMKSSVFLC